MTTPDTGPAAPTGERLLGPAEVRGLAERLGIRPTKKLGQNFVHDPNTVRRIVRAAGLGPDDVVVEVGPGLGSLTLALLPAVAAVHAVEIDPVLAAALPATVAEFAPRLAGRLTVTQADAMRVRAADLARPTAQPAGAPGGAGAGRDPGGSVGEDPASGTGSGEPSAIVANLPYNVAVPVLLHLLAELPGIRRGLVMVQAEVADRLAAPPGSRTYGVPSAKLAWFADARRAGPVPRAVFWPVPNVDSGLLAFARREPPSPAGGPVSREEVFAVVDAAFAQRRKALRPALAGWAGSAAAAEAALRAAGVDPMARAETLGIAQFAAIAAARPGGVPGAR